MPRRHDRDRSYYKQHAPSDRAEIPRSPQTTTRKAYMKQQLKALSKSPVVVKNTHSIDDCNSMFHPPSGKRTSSTIQRDSESTLPRESSFVRDSSTQQVVYHPPVDLEHNITDEEEIEQNRYRAALETSFTPSGVKQFERNMDNRNIVLAAMSSDTQFTTSTMQSYATSDLVTSDNTFTTTESPTNKKDRGGAIPFGVSSDYSHNYFLADEMQQQEHDDYFRVKQSFGYCAIVITAIQLLVIMLQLTLCGVAPLDVNYMVGPYPDAFSEWGGKNAYLIIAQSQIFRYVSPAFLNVGILHLLLNSYVQLETCAFFEREWGSIRWLALYILSEVGCVAVSCVMNPDTLAVGSSGAIMGIFGAKVSAECGGLTYCLYRCVVT